jgi:hypothetical protein
LFLPSTKSFHTYGNIGEKEKLTISCWQGREGSKLICKLRLQESDETEVVSFSKKPGVSKDRKAKNLLEQIALRLTAKSWATNICIRGSGSPASKMSKRVQWLDGAGLGLFETM